MKQIFTVEQLERLRTRPQGADWFMAIHKPRVVGNFSIANPLAYSGSVVEGIVVNDIDGASIAYAGQTGIVYDSSDKIIGDIRIRNDWDGVTLEFSEAGSGLISWKTASTIKVIDQYRPWLKHPRYNTATSQWLMDYDVPYTGQFWGPYANLGPPIVALPASSGKWVVDFWG